MPGKELTTLTIRSNRLKPQLEQARKEKPRKLVVNASLGFSGSDLEFLSELTWIEYLEILIEKKVDWAPLMRLPNLRSLSLNLRSDIRLSEMPKLERFNGVWGKGLELDGCRSLRSVTLDDFDETSLIAISKCRHLQHVGLTARGLTSFEGLNHPELLSLTVIGSRTSLSLAKLRGAPNLVEFEAKRCRRLEDLEALTALQSLFEIRLFDLKEPISAIAFVRDLPQLQGFRCVGTNIIDGDLTPLTNLKWIGIDYKRHYSITEVELHEIVKRRGGAAIVLPESYERRRADLLQRRRTVAKRGGFSLFETLDT